MEIIEIVVVAVSSLIVLGVIFRSIIRKKKGKSNECSGCPYSNQCSSKK